MTPNEANNEINNENDSSKTRQMNKNADQMTGSNEDSVKAATHSTDEAPHTHPAHVEHAQEPTGRHADDSWKKKSDRREDRQ